MRKSFLRVFLTFVLILGFMLPSQVFAWSSPGHMAIAYVAWQRLPNTLKPRVTALLQLNPYYPMWDQWLTAAKPGLSQADHDRDIFMLAATWSDEIKFDSAYTGTDAPPPGVTGTETNGSYGDLLKRKYWHFVDTPFSPDHTGPVTTPTPNAALQAAFFITGIASPPGNDALKSYQLVWLEHLVGDIHQPLHAASRFLAAQSDIGGNDVRLIQSPADELHAYWDRLPGNPALDQVNDIDTATAYASALPRLTKSQSKAGADLDVDHWVTESFKMAQKDAYASPIKAGLGPYQLNAKYEAKAAKDARLRVTLAGVRLANLLQAALK